MGADTWSATEGGLLRAQIRWLMSRGLGMKLKGTAAVAYLCQRLVILPLNLLLSPASRCWHPCAWLLLWTWGVGVGVVCKVYV